MRTFYCIDVNFRFAERTGFGYRSRRRGWLVQLIDAFDYQKDNESGQQKLYDDLDEIAVCDDRCSSILSCLEGGIAVAVEGDQHVGEIDLSGDECNDRHHDVIDQ